MADVTPQEMAGKLMADAFSRSGPTAQGLSDPAVETPMVVTLDDLRPYELDPRITRNPLYDEIKASIRERGLDAPPSITRRPGADHYIIRNGGNTRLAILRELWAETKDQRFFRIPSLFRPWPERGEIIALTGHLAENELHGGLTFIERALGVEKARELYEQEIGKTLSQSELARRLTADGYPIPQPHISRMQDTVRYLLPTIPNVLYNGLGRHQVERLAVLRKAAEFTWEKTGKRQAIGCRLRNAVPRRPSTVRHTARSLFDQASPRRTDRANGRAARSRLQRAGTGHRQHRAPSACSKHPATFSRSYARYRHPRNRRCASPKIDFDSAR